MRKVYTEKADIISYGLIEEYENYSKSKTNKIEQGLYDKKGIHTQIIPKMLSTEVFLNLACCLI